MQRDGPLVMGRPKGPCWACDGTGIKVTWVTVGGKTVIQETTCTACGGTGEK
jgi:hypothetical protein